MANREAYLALFLAWCEDRGITRPAEVTKPILERYQRHLYHHRKPNGQPLSFRSQYSRLIPIRAFFKWLTRQNVLLYNPASELELPRLEHRLPKHVLTASEAEAVLAGEFARAGLFTEPIPRMSSAEPIQFIFRPMEKIHAGYGFRE